MNSRIINNDKTKSFLYIIIVLLLIIISSCCILLINGNKKIYSRTIMIYMVGSNLESQSGIATSDLNSIHIDKLNQKKINVLLIAGGTKKWKNNYIDGSETSIYKLENGTIQKVKTQKLDNMGKSEVLSNLLNYVYDNYKTDKYDLILWNHGGAIVGSEFDELYDGDNLTLAEFKTALNNSPFNSNNKLELVIFRTCLNANIEMASVFSDYADYLVASEETTLGASYTSVLNFINDIEKNDDGVEVGKKYIKAYQNQIKSIRNMSIFDEDEAIYSTYSLIDLKNINKLVNLVDEFFGSINVQNNFNLISKTRANLRQYGSDEPSFDMVDLYSLVDGLKAIDEDKAEKLLNQLNNTVIYNWATNPESRGISIYFPYNGESNVKKALISIYNGLINFENYKNFISTFDNIKSTGGQKVMSFAMNKIDTVSHADNVDFIMELTDEQLETFAYAKYAIFRDNKDGYFKPIYGQGVANLDGNTLTASIRDKQLRVSSKTTDVGYILILFEEENNDKYIKYTTFVTLNKYKNLELKDWKIDRATMNLLYDKKNGNIDIINTLYDDTDLSNSAVVDIYDYDSIEFSVSSGWTILDENGNYTGPVNDDENGGIKGNHIFEFLETEPEDFKFELEKFDDEYDYYCVFTIYDTYGNTSYSKLIKMN